MLGRAALSEERCRSSFMAATLLIIALAMFWWLGATGANSLDAEHATALAKVSDATGARDTILVTDVGGRRHKGGRVGAGAGDTFLNLRHLESEMLCLYSSYICSSRLSSRLSTEIHRYNAHGLRANHTTCHHASFSSRRVSLQWVWRD